MNTNIFRSSYALAATFGLVALVAQPATAQTSAATGSMAATADITPDCQVNSTGITFGGTNVIDGAAHTMTGAVNVKCTFDTAWTASANAGLGTDATITTRKMQSGTDSLNYSLFTDTAGTTLWGDGTTGSTIGGTGTGQFVATSITGVIPANQTTLRAGSYADTVTVTVNY